MKQITKTNQILQLLRDSTGEEGTFENLIVYEAIALNTMPLRKRHPLYKGAIVDLNVLYQMAEAVNLESIPVHIQHESDFALPKGRVFNGRVVGSELRVLFYIDKNEIEAINKIDNSVVDQVSVSILTKQILNSVSGFDYLGADSTIENIYSGMDNDGNVIGEKGVYAHLINLDAWFELSLVGTGGAQNARIVSRDKSVFGSSFEKLAASGVDPSIFLLAASTETNKMDLSEFITKLTETTAEIVTVKTDLDTANATIASLNSQVETLTDANAALEAKLLEEPEGLTLALTSLQGVATKLIAASGKTDPVAQSLTEVMAQITSLEAGIVAAYAGTAGRTKLAETDLKTSFSGKSASAFRSPRNA